jgi:hypothetical protein
VLARDALAGARGLVHFHAAFERTGTAGVE